MNVLTSNKKHFKKPQNFQSIQKDKTIILGMNDSMNDFKNFF